MILKIKISIHDNEFALKPIIETDDISKINTNHPLFQLEKLSHFIVTQQLKIITEKLRSTTND